MSVYNVTTNTLAIDQLLPGETVSLQYRDKNILIMVSGIFKSTASNMAYFMDNFNSTITWTKTTTEPVSETSPSVEYIYTIAITNKSDVTVGATCLLHLISPEQV